MSVDRQAGRLTRHGLARVLSKRGICSRTEAARWIIQGRVAVAGRIINDPEYPADASSDITIDGVRPGSATPVHVALNKPRGLVTTTSDEQGRETVYACFRDADLGWLAPAGRLDKASEGLLLFSNDPEWAAGITDPATGPGKTYHVQVDSTVDQALLDALVRGVIDAGEPLMATHAALLRSGGKTSWLEIRLDEGRNRHIRRLLGAFDIRVLRLVRVAIGDLVLGDLPKGQWRLLSDEDLELLKQAGKQPRR